MHPPGVVTRRDLNLLVYALRPRRTLRGPDSLRAEWLRCSPTFALRPPGSSARRRSRSARRRRPLSRPKATAECLEDASCPRRCITGGKGAVRLRAQTPTSAGRAKPVTLIRMGEPRGAAGDARWATTRWSPPPRRSPPNRARRSRGRRGSSKMSVWTSCAYSGTLSRSARHKTRQALLSSLPGGAR